MKLKDFGLTGGNKKTLLILGAGASRGASFVQDTTGKPLPPLDLDFFQQIARLRQTESIRHLLEFVRQEYRHEVGLSMEQFFSEADYTDRFHSELHVSAGPIVKRYKRALGDFFLALPRLLHATTDGDCEFHRILAKMLRARDCIISFNYDCIIDRALRDYAGNRWDPSRESYGFSVNSGAGDWMRHGRGQNVREPIKLLKMHGAMNWRKEGRAIALVQPSADESLEEVVIPPTWFKDLTLFPFAEVWKAARVEVRLCRIMVVVGYSVPGTDLFSRSLFKVEAGSKRGNERLDLLVLVNPDPGARRSFLTLVQSALKPATRILEYATLRELFAVLERHSGD